MKAKMLGRALFWTAGAALGMLFNYWRGSSSWSGTGLGFWAGMMLAAVFIHFDPPETY